METTRETSAARDIWATIAAEARRESSLWRAALRPDDEQERVPVFSPLGDERFALGLETIYEGYLLHYGESRLFEAADRDARVLLGDYLYAHGLVRIAEHGEVAVVADLAELLALCAGLRAEADGRPLADGELWAATVALLGQGDGALDDARAALPGDGDGAALAALAAAAAGRAAVEAALDLHRARAAA